MINNLFLDSDDVSVLATIMHELTHFVDANIDGPVEKVAFTNAGVFPFDEVPSDVNRSSLYGDDATFIIEGCAELYTGKYFCHYARTYTPGVQFLTGIEYILGSDFLDETFFRHDSAWFFADMLMKHGFEVDEIRMFYLTMYAMSYWKKPTSQVIRPEDVLIRLYQDVIGEDYQDDPIFCHILACIYSPDFDFNDFPSPNEEFLKSIQLTGEKAAEWTNAVYDQLYPMEDFQFFNAPVCCIYLDGKIYLAAEIARFDKDGEMLPHDGLVIEYDFDTGKVLSHDVFVAPLSDYDTLINNALYHGHKMPSDSDSDSTGTEDDAA